MRTVEFFGGVFGEVDAGKNRGEAIEEGGKGDFFVAEGVMGRVHSDEKERRRGDEERLVMKRKVDGWW